MKVDDLVNIHWMNQDKLKGFMLRDKLYTQTDTKGMFVKIPYSNIMLHSAIHFQNVWINKNEIN